MEAKGLQVAGTAHGGRVPVIAGNWKMNKTISEARALVRDLGRLLEAEEASRGLGLGTKRLVVLCPPFTAVAAVAEVCAEGPIPMAVGAQDLFWEPSGAYTGEISTAMLKDAGASYVIIGHSERRQFFQETDEKVNRKIQAALEAGLVPIVCVGESLAQREAGETERFVTAQVEKGLSGLTPAAVAGIIIAYEPIWAIGTGKTATAEEANRMAGLIRECVAGLFGSETGRAIRIQYGGSVKPDNIDEIMSMPEVDGVLVGGASLEARSFARIAAYNG